MTVRAEITAARLAKVRGLITPEEGMTLYRLARDVERTFAIVELGSHTGLSTLYLASGSDAGDGAHVTAIDPWGDPRPGSDDDPIGLGSGDNVFARFRQNLTLEDGWRRVTPIRAKSTDVAPYWCQPIGLLFVDAVHELFHCRNDYEAWAPHIPRGGVIAFHDYFVDPEATIPGEVAQVIDEVVIPSGLWHEGSMVGGLWMARHR